MKNFASKTNATPCSIRAIQQYLMRLTCGDFDYILTAVPADINVAGQKRKYSEMSR